MLRRLAACTLLALCLPASARTRAVSRPDAFPAPRSVLWIAAHPDDEATPAPLLAYWCRERGARCTFLVMTRGESGPCLKSGGCDPDLGTTRAAEAAAASQYFGADSILLTLADGGGVVTPEWASDTKVVETIASYIRAADAELVITFDPRHGSTCHPDHRATGAIVIEAMKRLATPPRLYLLENRVTFFMQPVAFSIRSAIAGAEAFDANTKWNAVLDDMARHPSQFDSSWTNAAAAVPFSERFVFIAPAELALQQAVQNACP